MKTFEALDQTWCKMVSVVVEQVEVALCQSLTNHLPALRRLYPLSLKTFKAVPNNVNGMSIEQVGLPQCQLPQRHRIAP